jgi:hypothetical protein
MRDVIINLHRHSCKVPIILALKKLEFTRQFFEKYANTKFHKNPSIGNRVFHAGRRTDGQTDMAELIIAFCLFCERA